MNIRCIYVILSVHFTISNDIALYCINIRIEVLYHDGAWLILIIPYLVYFYWDKSAIFNIITDNFC